jgi:hypothetical protein
VSTFLERAGGKRPGCGSHGRGGVAESARGGDLLALEGMRIIARSEDAIVGAAESEERS